MSEKMKSILIVEDNHPQREALAMTLAAYKFEPICGETMAQVIQLLREHIDSASVVVLDMELIKFPDYNEQARKASGEVTGIGLTKQVLNTSATRRPEIIILSTYEDRPEYYKQALETGASAYLVKTVESDNEQFVPLIQALTLKHSFQPNALQDSEIAQLAEGKANCAELLEHFCNHTLAVELKLCLADTPFLLLYRDRNCPHKSDYENSVTGMFFSAGDDMPKSFDYKGLHRNIFSEPSRHRIHTTSVNLKGARPFAFIQLAKLTECEIALGIMSPFPVQDRLSRYPFSINAWAKCMLGHASPAVESFFQRLVFWWSEKQSVKEERVKTCVALSGNVQSELSPLVTDKPLATIEEAEEHFDGLTRLSDELTAYNRTLAALLDCSSVETVEARNTRLSDLIEEIKMEYDRKGRFEKMLFKIHSDCVVSAKRYYLSMALRSLVNWAFARSKDVEPEDKQFVQVDAATTGNWQELIFRDNSQRLSKRARDAYMSQPMNALSVAQMIIEVGCHGKFLDKTDELPGDQGHQFKIRLPKN